MHFVNINSVKDFLSTTEEDDEKIVLFKNQAIKKENLKNFIDFLNSDITDFSVTEGEHKIKRKDLISKEANLQFQEELFFKKLYDRMINLYDKKVLDNSISINEYINRFHMEANKISEFKFSKYFYICSIIIDYILSNNIILGHGRGSAVNSIFTFLIYASKINPVKYRLDIRRFLTENEKPDIDIDLPSSKFYEIINNLSIFLKKFNISFVKALNKINSIHPTAFFLLESNVLYLDKINNISAYRADELEKKGYFKIDLISSKILDFIYDIRLNANIQVNDYNLEAKVNANIKKVKNLSSTGVPFVNNRKLVYFSSLYEIAKFIAKIRPGAKKFLFQEDLIHYLMKTENISFEEANIKRKSYPYLFPKGHALAYALLLGEILCLRHFYPLAFYASYIKYNKFQVKQILKELKTYNINYDYGINLSEKNTVVKNSKLIIGFEEMNLSYNIINKILQYRPFDSFEKLIKATIPYLKENDLQILLKLAKREFNLSFDVEKVKKQIQDNLNILILWQKEYINLNLKDIIEF